MTCLAKLAAVNPFIQSQKKEPQLRLFFIYHFKILLYVTICLVTHLTTEVIKHDVFIFHTQAV